MSTRAPQHRGTAARTGGHRGTAARGHGAWRLLVLAVPLCLGAPGPALAQDVGVSPEHSPYRDILNPQSLVVFLGHFGGNSGRAGVGALPGSALGGRLDIRLSGPVDLWATVGDVASSRRVLSASGTDSVRFLGNSKLSLLAADLGLALNVTGAKSWHGLAPYLGIGLGVMAPSRSVTDSGGFRVGVNFTIVPTLGTRWFVSRDFAIHLEARDYYFRYQYPLAFFEAPFAGPPPRVSVLPLTTSSTEWTHNFTLWVGLAYGFTF